ncbi:outer membrane protein assembly factor BamA [Moraxella sp. ZY210820]|uniref:outer membrane protein assembly factor BamA n=1 Tax=unclassified Moraxella TaxID=2685852 RepID=UPI002731697B|nr:outer membrane protein assembly factor BamA [Moraxella sp. ZY210820]WLF84937.1 outer membrane protein assembly factor BamA [Moraxella sp. ZY210820]
MRFSHLFMPLALVSAIASVQAHASESFTVKDVRMSGLIRLTPANVQPYLPISVGDTANETVIAQTVSSLYASGLFEDVKSSTQDGIITFDVVERPIISKITLKGNKLLQKDMLLDGLKKMGIAEGSVYKKSAMHTIETELEQQYAQQGRYNADIKIETLETANNRVEVTINFDEGLPAKVVDINVIGNTVFKESEIKQAFAVRESGWSTVLSRKDRYAREKMAASLEALRTMYLNNGYINFEIENSQLDISEDKRHIFIEVKIKEGEKFNFGQSKFLGDAMFKAEDLDALRVYKEGDTYSQAQVNAVRQLLLNKYGNAGYYFTEINIIPKIDEATKTVDLNYYINPGQQVKVRRINFSGNTKTADEVLRREMRQMEGALASNEKIELSKIRLERTGFFKTVDMNIVRVPNIPDEVDIDVKVEEQHSGSTTFAVGYSQSGGMTFQAGLSQTNFLGTGNRVGIDLTRSQTQDYYNFSVLNPYYTIDGVSRGFNAYYRKTKESSSYSVTNYATDSLGGNITFGYPLDENQSVSATFGVDKTTVRTGEYASTYVRDYLLNNGGKARTNENKSFEGDFLTYNLNLAWAYNTLNRPVFPTSGMYHRVGLEVAVPGSDVDYQKITYDFQGMLPLWKGFALRGYGRLGYGNDMPFYKNYFAGGFGSVRGYEISTLGPRYDRTYFENRGDVDPEHVGGNALIQFGTELVLPLPFKGDWTRQVRPVLFAEGAQVFDTQCKGFNTGTQQYNRATNTLVSAQQYCKDNYGFDMNNMRYSVGAGFTWLTMIGPISLSYAYPLNKKEGDETKNVQFEIGRTF